MDWTDCSDLDILDRKSYSNFVISYYSICKKYENIKYITHVCTHISRINILIECRGHYLLRIQQQGFFYTNLT